MANEEEKIPSKEKEVAGQLAGRKDAIEYVAQQVIKDEDFFSSQLEEGPNEQEREIAAANRVRNIADIVKNGVMDGGDGKIPERSKMTTQEQALAGRLSGYLTELSMGFRSDKVKASLRLIVGAWIFDTVIADFAPRPTRTALASAEGSITASAKPEGASAGDGTRK